MGLNLDFTSKEYIYSIHSSPAVIALRTPKMDGFFIHLKLVTLEIKNDIRQEINYYAELSIHVLVCKCH